ncbi:MAG TPA: sensory rhodopsin transducer [Clostridiales bacterium]|nr:sensory rhodopsin transducer [Clostridiales bacterium]
MIKIELNNGKKIWYFPDGELPPPGDEPLKGHESIIILNDNEGTANVIMTLYFADRDPIEDIKITVTPKRVKCIRMDNPEHLGGVILPRETQYAAKLVSDIPVVIQYGRLDTRQEKMAFYTTMGLSF